MSPRERLRNGLERDAALVAGLPEWVRKCSKVTAFWREAERIAEINVSERRSHE